MILKIEAPDAICTITLAKAPINRPATDPRPRLVTRVAVTRLTRAIAQLFERS